MFSSVLALAALARAPPDGIIVDDLFVLVPNAVGLALFALQLGSYVAVARCLPPLPDGERKPLSAPAAG